MNDLRKETVSLGEFDIPADKLWGAQAQRSLEHLSIGNDLPPDVKGGGLLDPGTDLLGASPSASSATFIAFSVLEKCFAQELTATAWLPKLKQIIPSYGVSLIDDAEFCSQIRAATADVLKAENIEPSATRVPSVAKRA